MAQSQEVGELGRVLSKLSMKSIPTWDSNRNEKTIESHLKTFENAEHCGTSIGTLGCATGTEETKISLLVESGPEVDEVRLEVRLVNIFFIVDQ